jgi:WD40 repeat protein
MFRLLRIRSRVVVALLTAVATAGLALAQQTAPLIGTLDGHFDPVYAIAWSPDGKTLVTGGFGNTVRLKRNGDETEPGRS